MAFDKRADNTLVAYQDPIRGGFTVDASVSDVELDKKCRGINVKTDGNVSLTLADGTDVTLNLVKGLIHGVEHTHVLTAGTTATGITSLY